MFEPITARVVLGPALTRRASMASKKMGTPPPAPLAPVIALVGNTVTVAPTPLTIRVSKLTVGAPRLQVMLTRPAGVKKLLRLTVSLPARVLRTRAVLLANSIGSKLSIVTRPLAAAEPTV